MADPVRATAPDAPKEPEPKEEATPRPQITFARPDKSREEKVYRALNSAVALVIRHGSGVPWSPMFNEQLQTLREMKADWDGHGAPPPTAEAILWVEDRLREFTIAGMLPASVEADADGGAGLWFEADEKTSETGMYRTAWAVRRNDGQEMVVLCHNVPHLRPEVIPHGHGAFLHMLLFLGKEPTRET